MKHIFRLLFGTLLFAFQSSQAQTITITSAIPNPLLAGASFNIDFSITGTYNTKNVFTAQLSDSTGNFAAPLGIGSLKSYKSGTIQATIPTTLKASSGYKLRVYASMPVIYSLAAAAPVQSSTNSGIPSTIGALALDSLTDVVITTPASGQVLSFNGTNWVNISTGTGTVADILGLQDSLNAKLAKNASITGATKTKITYDAKGLVTAGADAAVADISGLQDSLNKKLSATITSPSNGQLLSYDGTKWVNSTPSAGGWSLTGNSGLSAATNFIGTTDATPLVFKVKGAPSGIVDSFQENTALGYQSLSTNNKGYYNAAFGYFALSSIDDGEENTAIGNNSLRNLTYGYSNTATGYESLRYNTGGSYNSAFGSGVLYYNTTGSYNSALGYSTLDRNTTGQRNTAIGTFSLNNNTTGSDNTAIGYDAGPFNGSGTFSNATAIGSLARYRCNDCLIIGAIKDTAGATASTRVGIGTTSPAASAAFEVKSTSSGVLIPRMTASQRQAIASPAQGLMVYETDISKGIWSYNGSSWASTGGGWSLSGNSGLSSATNFIGTTDGTPLVFKVKGAPSGIIDSAKQNTALGYLSLSSNTGNANTVMGTSSMQSNVTGENNSALGYTALYANTSGSFNSAFGQEALKYNTTGQNNTAVGSGAGPFSGSGTFSNAAAIGSLARYRCNDCLIIGAIKDTAGATASTRVGIGTTSPAASAAFEVQSTSSGVLIPRMTQAQRQAIASPAQGLLVFETDSSKGIWHYDGSRWESSWSSTGNKGFNSATNFIGTIDSIPLVFKVNNTKAGIIDFAKSNTAFGYLSLKTNTGTANTASGYGALMNNDGDGNTANGYQSLNINYSGTNNTAIGYEALSLSVTGNYNTATGYRALYNNNSNSPVTGHYNTASGSKALYYNTEGYNNTAIGYDAGPSNGNGAFHHATAIGTLARYQCDNCLILGAIKDTAGATASTRVGIGTTSPAASAAFEVKSTSSGILIPRMTQAQRQAIAAPAQGLLVYQTDTIKGIWSYDGSSWATATSTSGNVSSVSVVTANGFAGSVATSTTTPAITISTSVSGLLKGNGTSVSAAVAGTDFMAPNTAITGATKTKITYDNRGLVTAGADAGIADILGLQTALDGKVAGNTAITGATKTKIQYDAKGLVVWGDSAQLSDFKGIAISSPANGQVLSYNGSKWVNSTPSGGGSGWSLTGNSGLSSATNFIGTTDYISLVFKVNNKNSGIIDLARDNTSFGYTALDSNTTGSSNVAVGREALKSNTTGSSNVAVGRDALKSNTTGNLNTATGSYSLQYNTTGISNTANGRLALASNTTGNYNTALGSSALQNNIAGDSNTSIGYNALASNTDGISNTAIGTNALSRSQTTSYSTAIGSGALYNNTYGSNNTATGTDALYSNYSGNNNTANGRGALYSSTSGSNNTANGNDALYGNTSGSNNTANGYGALSKNTDGAFNTAVGDSALYTNVSGNYNTAIGRFADVSSSSLTNATAIGYNAKVSASNKVRIGNTSVSVIEGQVAWTNPSDGRYKKNVKEDAPGLNLIIKLRPVTYNFEYSKFSEHLKEKNADKAHLQQRESKKEMGFVAQEVEKALKDIGTEVSNLVNVPQSADGHYSLAYSELVVPLVRAVQEQQKLIQDQQKTIDDLKKAVDVLQKQAAPSATTATQTSGSAVAMETQASGVLLGQNIPNPFDGKTIIPFRIPAEFQEASIVISNLATGQVLKAYMVTSRDTQLSVDMSSAATGTYAYTLYVNGKATATKKLVVGR